MPTKLPVPVAMSFCDDLLFDPKTAKCHVIGWYDCIRPATFPHNRAMFRVVCPLTGTKGKFVCRIHCDGPTGDLAFTSADWEFMFPTRRRIVWVSFRILAAKFQKPGIYQVRLLCENQVVCERPLTVLAKEGNGDV